MIKKNIAFLFIFLLTMTTYSMASAKNGSCTKISNKYFSFTMPCETEGTYIVKKQNNGIRIIEKTSAKLNEGGFAFGLQIFKNPADYADLEGYKKIGELTDKKGVLYDMTLEKPVENICADEEKVIEDFLRLYDSAENIDIKGVKGSIYHKNQGMKGEDLYKDVLKKYRQAIKEHWDYTRIKQENIGSISKLLLENKKASPDKIGYAYHDINSDGVDELFIGEITKSNGTIYSVYTISDRKPVYVSGIHYPEDKLFVCNDNFLCKESHIAIDKDILVVLTLNRNSNKLNRQIEYMYNSRLNQTNPWFLRFNADDKYEYISEKEYKQGRHVFSNYKKFNYIPLSKLDSK